jgi:F-type H+-transporting ATPase subunit gamma
MAVGKEIRTKIKSISNTQKITKAMEMVAASKMKRAQDRMAASRPYAKRMNQVIGHLAMAHPEYRHPYMVEREVKRVGVIVLTTDRGLCGGLNVNLLRTTLGEMRKWNAENVELDFCVVGSKGLGYFRRFGGRILSNATHLGDTPRLNDLIGPIKVMLDAYDAGDIDQLVLIDNEFMNAMTQRPRVRTLIPVQPSEEDEIKHHWDYLYEPDAKELLDGLLMRYVESVVYQGVVENVACEMAARMVAMKSASENAGDLIRELNLAYNKARQAAITQEISEIVGGAAAV